MTVDVLESCKNYVGRYVEAVKEVKNEEDADVYAIDLMSYFDAQNLELQRTGRVVVSDSSELFGGKIANTAPNKELVKARIKIIEKGLEEIKAIYDERGWKF